VLNSKNFGVPQNRERIYIVGHLRGISRPEVFSFRESNSNSDETSEKDNITRTITTTHAHSWGWNISYVINQLTNPPHSGQRVYGTDGIAPTVTTGKKVWIPENTLLRRLTEIECERLQGFPDNWTEGISSTQRYKCLGNAVTVNVVYELARNL
jgi:site-specific DNA-cytosine methylase